MDPLWNPRKAVPDSEVIIARFTELSAWVRSNVSCRLDQPYGTQSRECFDVFLPDGNLEGLHIFIHGGFWMSRDKSIFSFLADSYTRRQWAFAIPNFPLMPSARIEQMVSSIRQACEVIWNQYARPLNALPWTVSGHSSGAHLVSQAVLVNKSMSIPEPASIALISGAYDLEAVQRSEVSTGLNLSEYEIIQQCTLKQRLRLVSSNVKLYVGAREPVIWTNQSEALAARLKSSGYGDSVTPVSLAGHDHFSILEPLAQPQSEIGKHILSFY